MNKSGLENVLILQGGGSLGAYECGVYKVLCKHKLDFDVIVGTSIGAVNAAIIVGAKSNEPAKALEEFWLKLSEEITSNIAPEELRAFYSSLHISSFGNPSVVTPIHGIPNPWMLAMKEPYLYDNSPLKETLKEFVDFGKLNKSSRQRLIITSVDIQNSKPVTFDSAKVQLEPEHIVASAGYPFYGISWTKINGRYLWDGSLLSNTPLREAIDASPIYDKRVFIVSLFPRKHVELPQNMSETWHRARDIMHTDKTEHNVKMSKVISRYINLIKKTHEIIEKADLDESTRKEFEKLEVEYKKLASQRGAIIKQVIRIERREESHFLLEDADFSKATIQKLIREGQDDAEEALKSKASQPNTGQ